MACVIFARDPNYEGWYSVSKAYGALKPSAQNANRDIIRLVQSYPTLKVKRSPNRLDGYICQSFETLLQFIYIFTKDFGLVCTVAERYDIDENTAKIYIENLDDNPVKHELKNYLGIDDFRIDRQLHVIDVLYGLVKLRLTTSTNASRDFRNFCAKNPEYEPFEGSDKCWKAVVNHVGGEVIVCRVNTFVHIIIGWGKTNEFTKLIHEDSGNALIRIVAGDRTLHNVIDRNADNMENTDTQELIMDGVPARLNLEGPQEQEIVPSRRQEELQIRHEELALRREELALQRQRQEHEMKLQSQRQEQELKIEYSKMQRVQIKFWDKTRDLLPEDPVFQIAITDNIKNLAGCSSVAVTKRFCPDFSVILEEMGLVFDTARLSKVGIHVSNAYFQKYGRRPENKVDRLVNGKIKKVNAYSVAEESFVRKQVCKFVERFGYKVDDKYKNMWNLNE